MITVDVITGPPGAGKSTLILNEMAATQGRYLWASPIIDLIDEQVPKFRNLAPTAACMAIHSQARLRGSVGRNIADLPTQFDAAHHAAAFISHDALLAADVTKFAGWHIRLDETPDAVSTGVLKMRETVGLYRDLYDLTPLAGTGWSRVIPVRADQNWNHLQSDDLGKHIVDFHKHAGRPQGLIINAESWEEARSKKEVEWFSAWSPLELQACATIAVTGAGFFHSVAYKVAQAWFGDKIAFKSRPAKVSPRTGCPHVRIHYFVNGHRGTTDLWSKSEGRRFLVPICDWLASNVPELDYWSGNEIVQILFDHRVPGEMTKAKLAGLNRLREATSCAFIYSNKPTKADQPLKSVFGMSDQEIIAARETEDIIQFAFRGAIRNPDFNGVYDIYLYHHDQAHDLKDALCGYGLHDTEIIPVPGAGIMDAQVIGAGKSQSGSPADAAQRRRDLTAARVKKHRKKKKGEKAAAAAA